MKIKLVAYQLSSVYSIQVLKFYFHHLGSRTLIWFYWVSIVACSRSCAICNMKIYFCMDASSIWPTLLHQFDTIACINLVYINMKWKFIILIDWNKILRLELTICLTFKYQNWVLMLNSTQQDSHDSLLHYFGSNHVEQHDLEDSYNRHMSNLLMLNSWLVTS